MSRRRRKITKGPYRITTIDEVDIETIERELQEMLDKERKEKVGDVILQNQKTIEEALFS